MEIQEEIKSYLFCSILESAVVRIEMEVVLRCENYVQVDALAVVNFTMLYVVCRLFTVLYFSVRSSRSSAIPDARPLGTIAVTVRSGISKRSHEKIGDCEQSLWLGCHFTVGVTRRLLLSSRVSLLVINLLQLV